MRKRRSSRRKSKGAYLLVLITVLIGALMGTFIFGRAYRGLAVEKAPFGRLSNSPSFDPVEDVTLGLPMDSGNNKVAKADPKIRAIEAFKTQVILLAGGRLVKSFNVGPGQQTLHSLVALVHDPAWLSESKQGRVITLNAAVVVDSGNAMTIAAPTTTEVVLTVRPGVFLAAFHAKLTISKVYIHASTTATPSSGSSIANPVDLGRPFILATDNSTMTVTDSTLRYLGRDWNSSYGLSWSKGSTGSVTGTLFEHNFIGVYTQQSSGVRIVHSQFYYNSLYGIDPHSGSANLLVEYNISSFNGRHGIIFSDHVVNGVVRYNVTKGNGLNGIMMDEASTNNRIDHNIVQGNHSDGIVLADSNNNDVTYNTVSGNRVGINVRGTTTSIVAARNVLTDNATAVQGIGLSGNKSYGNGGQWSASRIAMVWLVAAVALASLFSLTWVSGHVRRRRRRRGLHRQAGVRLA
jgi:poly(beta-D-mannuronate) C5 epimerase